MISTGPGGVLPPVRPGGEGPSVGEPDRSAPGTVSGTTGEGRRAVRAETAEAVEPTPSGRAATGLPREESNERASAARGLVEPARPDPVMFAGERPTEETPAGPPPTFDISILEKARAVAAAPPAPPPPGPAPDSERSESAGEGRRPEERMDRDAAENAPASQNDFPGSRPAEDRSGEATKDAARPDPTLRGAPAKPEVPGETA